MHGAFRQAIATSRHPTGATTQDANHAGETTIFRRIRTAAASPIAMTDSNRTKRVWMKMLALRLRYLDAQGRIGSGNFQRRGA